MTMLDASFARQKMQRTRGRAHVSMNAAPGGARLDRLHQSGSAKAMLPKVYGTVPEVVFLNTAGGLTGGDKMHFGLDLAPGARAVATTQTAERAYASAGGTAELDVQFSVGAGGRLDWLPQETILFEHCALNRRTEIALHGDAQVLMTEMIVLGRTAMGETLHSVMLTDCRSITRDGVPVLIEPLTLGADTLSRRDNAAGLRGARAFATLAFVAPGAEDALASLRSVLEIDGVEAAASGWNGKCVARFTSPDTAALRRALGLAIITLRGGPLPRVWQT